MVKNFNLYFAEIKFDNIEMTVKKKQKNSTGALKNVHLCGTVIMWDQNTFNFMHY